MVKDYAQNLLTIIKHPVETSLILAFDEPWGNLWALERQDDSDLECILEDGLTFTSEELERLHRSSPGPTV